MKKGYLKIIILICFIFLIFTSKSYGLELSPVVTEEAEVETKVVVQEPKDESTVILFTIGDVEESKENNNETEQLEECSVIDDVAEETKAIEEDLYGQYMQNIIRNIKKYNIPEMKIEKNSREKIELNSIIKKIISKIYDETENLKQYVNSSKDKRAKNSITKISNKSITNKLKEFYEVLKNNLLNIQKYAECQEYNRLSC